jgi:hypothetical protein
MAVESVLLYQLLLMAGLSSRLMSASPGTTASRLSGEEKSEELGLDPANRSLLVLS